MNTTRTLLTFAAALTLAAAARAQELVSPIEVTELSMAQDRNTQDVTIKYKFSNDGYPAIVRFDILTNGTSIGVSHFKHVSGDFSSDLSQTVADDSQQKTIVWKARTDWLGHLATDAVAHVTAYYTNDISYVAGTYLVVDLSGGPNATSYPVSYTLTPPDPSTDATCASNKLWLKRVEAGTFKMGSPESETGRSSDETQHPVTLTKSFFIGVFPVTAAQHKLVTGIAPSDTWVVPEALCPMNEVSYNAVRGTTLGSQWPATNAVDATSFFGKLRARTGNLLFDLPTEAQWEYACRAGTATTWNNGTDFNTNGAYNVDENLWNLGWYGQNSGKQTHPVGKKTPNAWGLYDCHGNMAEWCLDWYNGGSLGTNAVSNPVGATSGENRVQRGGSYLHAMQSCRSAKRLTNGPGAGYSNCGFRIACVAE